MNKKNGLVALAIGAAVTVVTGLILNKKSNNGEEIVNVDDMDETLTESEMDDIAEAIEEEYDEEVVEETETEKDEEIVVDDNFEEDKKEEKEEA
ncbi:MAG: hypothetical protein RR420_01450 [Anaerovoracaceae bacterium]